MTNELYIVQITDDCIESVRAWAPTAVINKQNGQVFLRDLLDEITQVSVVVIDRNQDNWSEWHGLRQNNTSPLAWTTPSVEEISKFKFLLPASQFKVMSTVLAGRIGRENFSFFRLRKVLSKRKHC